MIEQIEKLLEEIKSITASNAEELEALRLKYLSKKGIINNLMAQFREVPAEQKKEFGMKLNELKNATQEKINSLKESLESKEEEQCELDLTRPGYPGKLGTRHPLSIVKNEIIDIFSSRTDVITVKCTDGKIMRFPFLKDLVERVDVVSKEFVVFDKRLGEVSCYEN